MRAVQERSIFFVCCNNPLNDMDIEDKITKAERIGYFDINGNQYSKEFIDLYYEEVR